MAGGLVVLVTAAVILTTLFLVLRSAGGLNMIRELAAEQPEFVQAAQILGGTAVLIVALSLPLIVSASSFSGAALAADVALLRDFAPLLLAVPLFALSAVHLINGAIYVPTLEPSLRTMLAFAKVDGKRVIDLGSGDGRIVAAAAAAGAAASHGTENNPLLVLYSKVRLASAPRTSVWWGDLWSTDCSSYDVVFVFGMNHIMERLERKLKTELRPGALVVSNGFQMPTWAAEASDNGCWSYRVT